ncbi:YraN family protein [Candidatus Dependentiae bacterium]|nr:MAG: YraN family protein [Candidatus Dependentiae bacterium]
MITKQKALGNRGEKLVADKLEKQGFTILARNYRKQFGEIDLIASNKDLLIFVEVKLRSSNNIDLAELIVPVKQRRISAAAKAYIAEKNYTNKFCRFDVALIYTAADTPCITYIANAFYVCD